MADPCQRIVYQPLHPLVRPLLEEVYVEYHDKHFQFLKPDTQWRSDLREAPSRFALTISEPVEVGSVREFDLGKFFVSVYTPKGVPPTAGWPAILGMHGGGYALGSPKSDEYFWTRMCSYVVIAVGYRLAPDYQYPAAVEDYFDALKWVIEKGPVEIYIDKWCMLLIGISSGGNLAVVVTLKAVEAELVANIKAQILIGAVYNNTATRESKTWLQRPNAPLLESERMTLFQELYLGPRNSPTWAGEHWTASPIRAPQELLRKCPKTTIIIAGQDLLYAESLQFAERLRKEGVDVDVKIYEKAPHMFMAMRKLLDSGRQGIHFVVERVKEILAAYFEHSLNIITSDIKTGLDRENLLDRAKSYRLLMGCDARWWIVANLWRCNSI